MQKNKLFKILTIFFIFNMVFINSTGVGYAYSDINFRNITIEDGLSQASVETLYQDSDGYIWIGTNDGLNRYNGHDFRLYSYEGKNRDSIVNNYIIDIKEDHDKNIWVGTASGISKIDMKTGDIKNYTDSKDHGNLSHYNIGDILITKEGNIIVGTSGGLNIYNKKEDKFEQILEQDNQLTSQVINTLTQDINGDIWIGTKYGVDRYDLNLKIRKDMYQNEGKNSLSESSIYKVYYDKSGYIWVGTSNSGLSKINLKNNEITRYKNNLNDKNSLPGSYIRNMLKDSKNNMWICTEQGLAKYNSDVDNFTVYNNKVYDKNSLVDNEVFSIIEDKSGLIWVGTYAGISIFDPDNEIQHYKTDPFNKNSINDNLIQGIYEDNEGLLWVGTNSNGINVINRKNDIITRIDKENENYKLSDYSINDITGENSKIYIATNNGLNIVDKKSNQIKCYFEEDNIANNNIKKLYIDKSGNLWIGTIDGISILNTKDGTIKDYTNLLKKLKINDTYVSAINEDKNGYIYIGFFLEGGVLRLNPKTYEFENYKTTSSKSNNISSNSIKVINKDKKGDVWIGTRYGLNKFDSNSKKFINYTTKDGLSNNTIYGILFDKQGNPWVSTNLGISKLDIKSNKFQSLGITDGLQSNEFNGNAYFQNKEGEFFFGGINGLNTFYPSDIKQSSFNTKVAFDEFNVDGEPYKNIDGKKFKSNQNTISINFFLPSYKNTGKIRYYYKLENAKSDWYLHFKTSEWNSSENNSVVYSNLDPGNYEFKVVARNNNGSFSIQNNIKFTIEKPFWKSNTALLLYSLIMVIALYYYINRMKRLDKLVYKRTSQLRNEMEKNNKLLNKVIQLEKNKYNYFVNLSHELRTPLNVINGTQQLITELNKKEEGLSKSKINHYMNVIDKNSKRLLNLINNIIDSTKLQNDQYIVNLEKHDIIYIVEETVLGLRDYIESKGIELILDPEIEEKIIQCDNYEIERCIVNLIGNAVKFTPMGGKIEVKIKDLDDKVMISIKDSGIGIEKKFHNSIFDRFNQVIDANAEVKGGSGLGLTITKQIIQLHKGSIHVESEVGKGSNFIIILPEKIK
ncbi:MAG: ligand-binding sensor domain-containing protein [Paraclostridium sp.]|uniref:ligand-binding sensor domain-containing protein n=1 Tax=Paraclostridium sp. TaxID=2023273 RepID=UPI003F2EF2C8